MTPSKDRNTAAVRLRIGRCSPSRGLDSRDVDLAHGHHGFHRSPGRFPIGIGHVLEQRAWRDLPREAPPIPAPAAGPFFPAPADDRLPIAIRFRLVLGHHHEADRLVGAKVGAAIEANERPAQKGELDRQLLAFVTAWIIGRGGMRRPDMAAGEGAGVEVRRLAGLVMVEPQAGHKFGHHFGSSLEWREPATPKVATCGTPIPAASTSRRLSRAASQSRISLEATAQCPQSRYTTLLRACEVWGSVQADGPRRLAGDEEPPSVDGLS